MWDSRDASSRQPALEAGGNCWGMLNSPRGVHAELCLYPQPTPSLKEGPCGQKHHHPSLPVRVRTLPAAGSSLVGGGRRVPADFKSSSKPSAALASQVLVWVTDPPCNPSPPARSSPCPPASPRAAREGHAMGSSQGQGQRDSSSHGSAWAYLLPNLPT